MLIVLRGNSGSGKTTTASMLRSTALANNTHQKIALIEQDYLRRALLKEKEVTNGDNIDLIRQIAIFALSRDYHVILEGMLVAERYESMLKELAHHSKNSYFFYFDIPFEETLKRHRGKPNAHEFGEPEMRKWFKDKDFLSFTKEDLIDVNLSQQEVVQKILQEVSL